jgi:hypothetical protein
MEEKVSLPKKTKIATQWINLLAGAGLGLGILALCTILIFIFKPDIFEGIKPGISEKIFKEVTPTRYFFGILLGLIVLAFFYWSSIQLMRGKKWAWWFWVVGLSIIFIGDIIKQNFSFDSLIILIPLILLLLDRKNFWKVAK